MKLTRAQKKGIKTWLQMVDEDKKNYCPFDLDDYGCEVCAELFPKVRPCIKTYKPRCPCQNYTLAHVIRVARKAVE